MSTLVTVPRNGGLTRTPSLSNFPNWSFIDDILNANLPSVFSTNFNAGITLPKVNIKEEADAYFVDMAVPGF